MQAIAAWLVARPLNGVIGLALTIWLQSLSFISAIVLVVLILSKGLQRAMLDVAAAIGIVIVVGALAKVPLPAAIVGALIETASVLALTIALGGPWAMGWHLSWQMRLNNNTDERVT